MTAIERYAPSDVARLARTVSRIVHEGGIVALPTETFYGFGVDPFNEQAVDRLLRLKGRGDGKPILILIGQRAQLPRLVTEIPSVATVLMDAFWPGPLTIVLSAHTVLPHNVTAGTGTVGVRLSSCAPLTELLAITGPLTGTSANRAGETPATEAARIAEIFGGRIDLIIDAGSTAGGLPSTVVDARHGVHVIREGAVTRQKLRNVLETHGISLA